MSGKTKKNNYMKYFYFILVFFLTSCVEIIDDLQINLDGSGTFKYTLNLSQSKLKAKALLSLDSLDGMKMLKETDIKNNIILVRKQLKEQEGIKNVVITEDYDNYIFKLQFDFNNVETLETALKSVVKNFYNTGDKDYDWVSYDNKTLNKSIPSLYSDFINNYNQNELEKLKTGTYTSITRFQSKIKSFTNEKSLKSKSGMASMIKVTPYDLLYNQNLIVNKIILEK
jgi:hypothetical protein